LADHSAALLGAATAGFRAPAAVLHRSVAGAFFGAAFAYLCAQAAHGGRVLAVAGHVRGRQPADLRAVDVERNAARKVLRVLFLQAGRRAVIAFIRTGVARLDAGLKPFVSHEDLLRFGRLVLVANADPRDSPAVSSRVLLTGESNRDPPYTDRKTGEVFAAG
jgi:hypothetical protein